MKKLLQFRRRRRPALPILDASGWYAGWYLDHRIEEELSRAKRYQMTFTLLYILIDEGDAAPGVRQQALDSLLSDGFRRSDLPSRLSENEYAVLLPNTDADQARVVQDRVRHSLAELEPAIGLSNYPADSREQNDLLAVAAHRALASTGDPLHAATRRAQSRRTR